MRESRPVVPGTASPPDDRDVRIAAIGGTLVAMALPPGRPLADPLLAPDAGPRDASGEVVRAPVGNSGRTLVAFLLLAALGVAVWWLRRPADLTERLAGTEWVVVDHSGQPHVNADGQVSAFALGRRSMIRAGGPCGSETGQWTYDVDAQAIEVDWADPPPEGCADESGSWVVVAPATGALDLDGDQVRIGRSLRAFSITDREPAAPDEFAGRWRVGELVVEIGERGLFEVGECSGGWDEAPDGIRWRLETTAPGCEVAAVWSERATFVPHRFEDALYLWRVPPGSAFDPLVLRLEPTDEGVSPLLPGD